ncbi:MAG: hypothetical protein FWE36_08390 [Erysipelotrichales bacterium]|nr:hypothetical protein [Erysipelotrichales bacterium]
MKKLFASLFVATALFLLVGCNWGGGTTEENPFQTIQGWRFDSSANRMTSFNIDYNDLTSSTPSMPAFAYADIIFDVKSDVSLNVTKISFTIIPECDMIILARIINGRGVNSAPVGEWITVEAKEGIAHQILIPATFELNDRFDIQFRFLINIDDSESHPVGDMYLWKQNGRNGEEVPGLPMDGKSFIFQLYNFDFRTA